MDEGLKNLITKAEQGDVEAMVMVGDCYNRGFHADKDDVKAHIYYKMAADKGHAKAAYIVSTNYLNGFGVPKNKKAGIKYLQMSADKGLAEAQYYMALVYQIGEDGFLFREQKEAMYFEKAAKQGHAKAQIELANMHILKEGAQYSLEKGLFWLVCAYLHGAEAEEDSDKAKKGLNSLLKSGLPGGMQRVNEVMENVKKNYSSYLHNPK